MFKKTPKTKILVVFLLLAILCIGLGIGLSRCGGDDSFKLTFEIDGVTYNIVPVTEKEEIKMPSDPTKEDFTFEGWYLDKNVWEKPFTADSLIGTSLKENLTVYAKWSAHTYGEWSNNETNHWNECSVCLDKKDEAAHDFVSGVCSVCAYKKLELSYSLNGETYTVTGIGTVTDTDIVIPKTYEGKPVTSIGTEAFNGCTSLTSITIPNGVTSIGNGAFKGCSGLKSVTIPESVTSIGTEAFAGCGKLTSITIPDSVIIIGDGAFNGCRGLTSITIPNSVTSIGASAFNGCTKLVSVKIGSGVTILKDSVFAGCGFTSITIPNSVTSIVYYAFFGCNKLTSITYIGTKTEWKAIPKGSNWDQSTGEYTIICSDGILAKGEN